MTIAMILIALSAIGFVTSYPMGGLLIDVLLVVAIIAVLVRVTQGRSIV